MRRRLHLHLHGVVCRLAPGDVDHEAASREWEDVFGILRSRDFLAFTNARMGFIRGVEGQPDGLVPITIGVEVGMNLMLSWTGQGEKGYAEMGE